MASSPHYAYAQARDAIFYSVQVPSKIYYGDNLTFTVTVRNDNAGLLGASLYFTSYLDGSYWSTSSEQYILKFGFTGAWTYYTSGMSPGTHTLQFYLYWDNGGSSVEEDVSSSYSFTVAYVHVSGWSPQSLTVQRGQATASSLLISFSNGGNDVMYSTSVSVQDSKGLAISPSSQGVGNIGAGGTSTVSFSVSAPASLSAGTYYPSFTVSYGDFEGGHHSETYSAQVGVIALTTNLYITVPGSAKMGDTVAISARLVDGNGNPAPGQSISFSIGGSGIGTSTTDGTGTASITYSVSVSAGTYTVEASFPGTSSLGGSSATGTMVVNPYYLTLISSVPNAQLFTVNGAFYTTDASGKARIPINTMGSYSVQVISPYTTAQGTRVVFVQWTDGVTSNPRTVVMDSDQSYTIATKTQYMLGLTVPADATALGQGWYDSGANATFSTSYSWNLSQTSRSNLLSYSVDGGPNAPVTRSAAGAFNFTLSMGSPHQVSFSWVTQYLLSITGGHNVTYGAPSPTSDGWYDRGTTTTVMSDYMWNVTAGSSRVRLTGWSLDGSQPSETPIKESGSYSTSPIDMSAPHSVAFTSVTQYYLAVSSPYGSAAGSSWYDEGSSVPVSLDVTTVDHGNQTRHVFVGWSGGSASGSASESVVVGGPETVTASWKTQYFLNVTSQLGQVGGSGWYDAGASATASVTPTRSSAGFLSYNVFSGWTGSASGGNGTITLTMDSPKAIKASWGVDSTQLYLLTVVLAAAALAAAFVVMRRRGRPKEAGGRAQVEASEPKKADKTGPQNVS